MSLVVRNINRVEAAIVSEFAGLGVATVHEAQGRSGLLDEKGLRYVESADKVD